MTRGWQTEWKQIIADVEFSQRMRGRNIISEIIDTAKKFNFAIGKYTFEKKLTLLFVVDQKINSRSSGMTTRTPAIFEGE